jgi:hypothetical protein
LELRVAFDFDGVAADDSSEAVYKKKGLKAFQRAAPMLLTFQTY